MMNVKRITTAGLVLVTAILATIGTHRSALGHCQVPCGIYDDPARFQGMLEDATTIKKAMVQINELASKDDALSLNQAARWVTTKEAHAAHIITTISEYFLTQKVKEVTRDSPGYPKYLESLAAHHLVLRAAMKTKQTVDPANADTLRATIEALQKQYRPGQA